MSWPPVDDPSGSLHDFLVAAEAWLPLALFTSTFFSEDLTCMTAGVLIAEGHVDPITAMVWCAAGILASDIALWWLGYASARGLLRWRWLRERVPAGGGRWRAAFERRGFTILFVTRFLPGARMLCYLAAGAMGYPLRRFTLALSAAVVLWVPLFVGFAWGAGEAVGPALEQHAWAAWLVVPALILIGVVLSRTLPLLFHRAGRQVLRGRLRRLRYWEYWPVWVVYLPVVLEMVRQALVRRRVAVFTACNPGIPFGGLALESKSAILAQIDGVDRAGADRDATGRGAEPDAARVAAFEKLAAARPLAERLAVVSRFLEGGRCVLKPDSGERGTGVEVVDSLAVARAWFATWPGDAIVQEWVPGAEFGIVWQRCPRTGEGRVRSIAQKVLPEVVGDGRRTLEELILDDRRHRAMAGVHRRRLAERLDEVPAAGERVLLGELGTHCRGATFLDARHLASAELQTVLDVLMANASRLDFGRFDVRCPDAAALAAGRGIRVLEFNGVTGEPAHVYHPGYPLWRGLADLVGHWRAACDRGAANAAAGHRSAGIRELWRLVVDIRRRRRGRRPERIVGTRIEESA